MDSPKTNGGCVGEPYTGPFFYDDEYLDSIEDVIEYCEAQGIPIPEFVSGARYVAPTLDPYDILDDLRERCMHEDWEPKGVEGLVEAVGEWNRVNAENGTWWEDITRRCRVYEDNNR